MEFNKYQNLFLKIKRAKLKEISSSNDLLFMDFFSRIKYWRIFFKTDIDSLSIFMHIDPKLEENIPRNGEFISSLRKNIRKDLSNYDCLFIYLFIYWQKYKDTFEFLKYKDLPAPYDSVIKVLERGGTILKPGDGSFSTAGGIGGVGINKLKEGNRFLPSLEEDFLDLIDITFRNIPSQEEVEALYKEHCKK